MSLISILISLSIITQTHSPPRCWIGVIDQITPPWLSVAGEHGETLLLSLDKSYSGAKEGDWVIYWTQQKALQRLDSPFSRAETEALRRLLRESLFSPP